MDLNLHAVIYLILLILSLVPTPVSQYVLPATLLVLFLTAAGVI